MDIEENDFGPQTQWHLCKHLGPVRHQGRFLSCWAFACLDAIRITYKLKRNEEIPLLSPQDLIDSIQPIKDDTKKQGCDPYKLSLTFQWLVKYGATPEHEWPYSGYRGCARERKDPNSIVKIKGYSEIKKGDEDEIIKCLAHHPVASGIPIAESFKYIGKEIYMGPDEGEESFAHAVLVVGYGTDTKTRLNYWIIKNSFGTDWGVRGYGRIIRQSSCPPGKPPLLGKAFYPIV